MVPQITMISLVICSLTMTGVRGQAPPYWGGSDVGVLPMYLENSQNTDNRLGASSSSGAAAGTTTQANKELHGGTLETEDVYNRVSEWPDDRKPFWYLNAVAIQKQREQQQQQRERVQQQQQAQNRRPVFASSVQRPSTSRQ